MRVLAGLKKLDDAATAFEVQITAIDPRFGTEAGKERQVVVIQNNLLNKIHPSTTICPITTNIQAKGNILRVHLKKEVANLKEDCDILVDQLRAIDNKRFIKRIGIFPMVRADQLTSTLRVVLNI